VLRTLTLWLTRAWLRRRWLAKSLHKVATAVLRIVKSLVRSLNEAVDIGGMIGEASNAETH